MRNTLIAASLACTLLFGATPASAANLTEQADRARLADALVQKWGAYVSDTYRMSAQTWAEEMEPAFAEASMEELEAAARAATFDTFSRLLLGQEELVLGTVEKPKALGNVASDLVYVPVAPCRILDTRIAGGQIAANTIRGVDVTSVGSYAFQGGSNTDCGGAGAAGSFAAVVVNLTVVTPAAAGYITAYPSGTSQPLAATVNYTAGAIVGNSVIVTLDQGAAANEMDVFSFATTHLVADITGYFINPAATAFDCVETASSAVSIAVGGVASFSSPACPATYAITGGGCTSSTFDGRVVSSRPFQTTRNYFCAFRNEGTGTMQGVAYANCCRVPGR